MVYGHLFPNADDEELASLKAMGQRWKQYEKEGKWIYEAHPFWITLVTFHFLLILLSSRSNDFFLISTRLFCSGYTFWELLKEAPDLFLHLADSDLVIFKGLVYFHFPPPLFDFCRLILLQTFLVILIIEVSNF